MQAALTNHSGNEDVWINSNVQWGVSNGAVQWVRPYTTTGKTSYYSWFGDIDGEEYVSSGFGYVNKSRPFSQSGDDQATLEVYVNGTFGHTSIPVSQNGGCRPY